MGQFRNYGFSGAVYEPLYQSTTQKKTRKLWSDEVYFAAGQPGGQKSFAVDKTRVVCYLQKVFLRVLSCIACLVTFI